MAIISNWFLFVTIEQLLSNKGLISSVENVLTSIITPKTSELHWRVMDGLAHHAAKQHCCFVIYIWIFDLLDPKNLNKYWFLGHFQCLNPTFSFLHYAQNSSSVLNSTNLLQPSSFPNFQPKLIVYSFLIWILLMFSIQILLNAL